MNRADEAEFEVIRKACDRRLRDRGAFSALGSTSSTAMARKMAEEVQTMMGGSMEAVRGMTRDFVEDLIRKNAPDIDEEELARALDSLLPPEGEKHDLPASPFPPEMLLSMARDFVSYSEGSMAPSRQKELWDEMPRWQDEYWSAFPAELKAIIKAYIEAKINAETFTTALLTMLGL